MIEDKEIKIQGDNIERDGERYMGTPNIWALITERNPEECSSEDYGNTKSSSTIRTYSIVTTILGVVTLVLTNQKNGLKFSDRFRKIFNGKGSCLVVMRNIKAPW